MRQIHHFVFIHGQYDEIRAVHSAVFGELEVALRARQLAKIYVGVERVIVHGERKRALNDRIVVYVFEIVGYLDFDRVVRTLFAVNGDGIFGQEGIGRRRREDDRGYGLHVLVVVHRQRDVVSVLFESLVIHLFVGCGLDDGRFVVENEIEGEAVPDVCGNTAVAVVEQAFHLKLVSRIVAHSQSCGFDFEELVVRNGSAAVRVRLVGVVIDVLPHDLARVLVGD